MPHYESASEALDAIDDSGDGVVLKDGRVLCLTCYLVEMKDVA